VSDLFALGLNHKSAPVELRERLAIPDDDHASVLGHLH
jgi:glutamyl-tRNA reductase